MADEEVIGGYRLLKHMATGQTSQVWEVVEANSGRHFAMKLLLPEKVRESEHRRMLLHEADVGILLTHPNIIRIVTISREAENPYFVMEFFPAGSVKARLLRKENDFIREKAHDIFKQAATALAFMNAQGWVHRDIKPDNMLVNSAGEMKLIDFAIAEKVPTGLAKLFYRKKKPQGTRSYMSPEQIRGQPLDGRADIYSYAATAFEVVTGRPPFRGNTAQDLLNKHLYEKPVSPCVYNPTVTKGFGDLLVNMLAKKREDRPKNFHEVLIQLRNLLVFKDQPTARPPRPS